MSGASTPVGRLIIVCGLPGTGKTTRARALEARLNAVRLSPDDWMAELGISLHEEASRARIEALQWNLGQQLLNRGLTVVIEWGTWARSERDALRSGARALGARVELHYVSAPPDVLIGRIQSRSRENPPIREGVIHEWYKTFEVPTEEELALYDPPLPDFEFGSRL